MYLNKGAEMIAEQIYISFSKQHHTKMDMTCGVLVRTEHTHFLSFHMFLLFQILFLFYTACGAVEQPKEVVEPLPMPTLREAALLKIPRKFHSSLRGAAITITSQLKDVHCRIRISRFEFKCSEILRFIAIAKKSLDSKNMSVVSHSGSQLYLYILCIGGVISCILFSVCCLIVFRKAKAQNVVNVALTACDSSSSTV